MPLILGLDASIKKSGFSILDTDAPDYELVDRGRLRTSRSDGILIQRLIKQYEQIKELMDRYSIDFVSMEAPYFGGDESEHLFALNQFIHKLYLERGTFVICFPPQQMKKLAIPEKSVNDVHKVQMTAAAKDKFNLHGHVLTDDEADAIWAGHLGKLFYNWHFTKTLPEEKLHPLVRKAFCGTHTYVKGAKAGSTDRTGMIYRENELFFDFKKIAERRLNRERRIRENASKKSCEKSNKKGG